MICLILFSSFFTLSCAIGCTPDICKNVQSTEPLNCPGSVIKNGGYCGCSDVCAKMEGQACKQVHQPALLASRLVCDDGLVCQLSLLNVFGWGTCVKSNQYKRAETSTALPTTRTTTHTPRTLCEKTRAVRLTSNVTWKGMWIPKCDEYGQFMEMQCDNIGQCFCVDPDTGKVDELTKTHGPVFCW